MSNSFWEALSLNNFETTKQECVYKLYYDSIENKPLFFSTEDHNGDYIEVTKEQYETFRLEYIAIVDGSVKELEPQSYQLDYVHPYKGKKFSWIKGD